jgi:transposase InsO family protein
VQVLVVLRGFTSTVRWGTREELRIAIVTWIERTWRRRRRQSGLGRLSPIEFETIMITPASQTA